MNITQGLHRAVQQHPDAVATVFGGRTRTHAESMDRIGRLADALHGLGVRAGDRTAMLSLNSDHYHEYIAATLWAGGVVVPVNHRWSVTEIADSLAEVSTGVLFVDRTFAATGRELATRCPTIEHVVYCDGEPAPEGWHDIETLIAGHRPVEDVRRGGADLAAVFYTGGTTGRAKGVMLSHRNLLTSAYGSLASEHFLSPEGTYLHAAPMFHLADLAAWTAQVVRGGRHVVVPAFEPVAVLSAIQGHGVTDILLVPTMIQALVDHPRFGEFDVSGLRRVLYGASPMSEGVLNRALAALPDAEFTQLYGMTELSPAATVLTPADHAHPSRRRSAGRAAPHAEVRVVDPADRELSPGQVGEIVARGEHVMLGYWNRPEETATALRGGWMHTGDGGYLDADGYVYVSDRIKDMIISGGENVYSVEVENVLTRHPLVTTCAVIGVPDEVWGERVHAVIVPSGDGATTLTLEDVRAFCRDLIAAYKIPRSMEIVELLPMSGAGKVLKRELRARYWSDAARNVH
jgi:acyl-CoA synthetase (AMP-forming)/AMP-acid ligase II